MVSKLYLTAALLALALAGHIVLEQNGEVIADLMQNSLARAPDCSYDSERLGCVTSSGRRSRQEAKTCSSLRDIGPCLTDPLRR